jgi:hypothetical protein
MRRIKYHPNGKKKKEVLDMIKNERDFKLIINYDAVGDVSSVMEKPNVKTWTEFNPIASGAHVFANSQHNHVDFFKGSSLTHKEYPEVRGSTNYGYNLSGARVII